MDDYRQSLEWYMTHVSNRGVHAIELATSGRNFGPFWTYITICLSNVCPIDLDFAYKPAAVRPQI